jgi:hypothetical protein
MQLYKAQMERIGNVDVLLQTSYLSTTTEGTQGYQKVGGGVPDVTNS